MAQNNKDFTFADYLTIVTYTVDSTIVFGSEYKNFFLALALAQSFYGYEVDDGELNLDKMEKIWNDIRSIDDNGTKRDLYALVCEYGDYFLPIEEYVYDDMIAQINTKLFNYENRNPVRDAVAELIKTANDYLTKAETTMSGIDIGQAVETLTGIASMLGTEESRQQAISIIAHEAHKAGQEERKKEQAKKNQGRKN